MKKFEIGNIYPPLEKNSIKIQVTQGCPWNQCSFCNSYKNIDFKIRNIESIISDIESIKFYIKTENRSYKDTYFYERAIKWKYSKKVFLGDSSILKVKNLLEIMLSIKNSFETIECFSAYASIQDLWDIDKKELQELKRAGLKKLYIGFETGCEEVLKLSNKKHKLHQILSSHKKAEGIDLFDHYIIGLGGKQWFEKHAIDSANLLNKINPKGIELRTIQVYNDTKLKRIKEIGDWSPLNKRGLKKELFLFLSNLNFEGKVYNNHKSNEWIES